MSRLVALAALALIGAACGSTDTGSTPSPSPSTSPSYVSSTPASTPSAVPLIFALNGIGTTAKGTINLTKGSGTFTVELKIAGLQAMSSHISHIHIGSCAARGGIKYALNQVVADGQGDAVIKTTIKATYPPSSGRWYVVVHAGPDFSSTANQKYLLCGNLFK